MKYHRRGSKISEDGKSRHSVSGRERVNESQPQNETYTPRYSARCSELNYRDRPLFFCYLVFATFCSVSRSLVPARESIPWRASR